MADLVAIRDATGATVEVSSDEVTTINGTGSQPAQQVQRVQLATVIGAAATDISSTNALPVNDAGGTLSVDDGGRALRVDGSAVTQPVSGNVGLAAQASGGWTPRHFISAASTNATSVKASAGQLGGYIISNNATAKRYVKFYDKVSAPTVGTDTPVLTIELQPGALANVEFTQGMAFANGIAFAITAGIADSDTTAVGANEVIVNLGYK